MLNLKTKCCMCVLVLIICLMMLPGCTPKPAADNHIDPPAAEEPKPSPASPTSDQNSVNKALTQQEAAEQFVKNHGYTIEMNSGANFDLQFPGTFSETKHGVQIGEMLRNRNELSKQNGLNFSSYLGKPVTLLTYGIETKQGEFANIDLVMDGNKIVGFWIDKHTAPPDFNVIVGAYQDSSPK